jgi:hypothetical protein
MFVVFPGYPVEQYKKEKYGKYWRIKTIFVIISPSAYAAWAGGKMVADMAKGIKQGEDILKHVKAL